MTFLMCVCGIRTYYWAVCDNEIVRRRHHMVGKTLGAAMRLSYFPIQRYGKGMAKGGEINNMDANRREYQVVYFLRRSNIARMIHIPRVRLTYPSFGRMASEIGARAWTELLFLRDLGIGHYILGLGPM